MKKNKNLKIIESAFIPQFSVEDIELVDIHQSRRKTAKHNKQCRICLENENQSNSPLITPCKCTGSVKYVHQSCLQQWIKKDTKVNRMQALKKKANIIECQMCRGNIVYYQNMKYKCAQTQQVKKKINQKKCVFYIIIFELFLVFLTACGVISLFITGYIDINGSKFEVSIMIGALVLTVIFLFIGIYFLLDQFLRNKYMEISLTKQFKKNAIHPQQQQSIAQLNQNI